MNFHDTFKDVFRILNEAAKANNQTVNDWRIVVREAVTETGLRFVISCWTIPQDSAIIASGQDLASAVMAMQAKLMWRANA